jgi:SNF2 family DNA or RNA helicase
MLDFADTSSSSAQGQFLLAQPPESNSVAGKIHFNLAEAPHGVNAPFAFIATYTAPAASKGRAQHQPISAALRGCVAQQQLSRFNALWGQLNLAASKLPWLKRLVDTGDIYHPVHFTAEEAYACLKDSPTLGAAGIIVRTAPNWKGLAPGHLVLKARVGDSVPSVLGADGLLDFKVEVTLDDEPLSEADLEVLSTGGTGLKLLRGRWIEIDQWKLDQVLERFKAMQQVAQSGVSLAQALRLVAGVEFPSSERNANPTDVAAGPWLMKLLRDLRSPDGLAQVAVGESFLGELDAYQNVGVRWLYLLHKLGLGACLADDMGLGKTIQTIALLLILKEERLAQQRPNLPHVIIAPAGVLSNWAEELTKFAPSLKFLVAHPSVTPSENLARLTELELSEYDVVLTAYSTAIEYPWVTDCHWNIALLDEAQAIKNPDIQKAQLVKKIQAQSRIALTGTPIENRHSDLWSIFDYINPGLLGTETQFADFVRKLVLKSDLSPLRELVSPYLLRRLKTDKAIKKGLPPKFERPIYCPLTSLQAADYQLAVDELALRLKAASGIGRQGVVLSYITRFKQICNSSAHWHGDTAWAEANSGKLQMLRKIARRCVKRGEKLVVFSQYAEAIEPISAFLTTVFGRPGLSVHGRVSIKKRTVYRNQFQRDPNIPFFVMTLGTGGAGINLTAANRVVHFDRWWNPAVENQGTDRTHRRGQKKTVYVYKFICRGTIEDRIDRLIESKLQLVDDLLIGTQPLNLTKLSDEELLRLVALDLPQLQKAA